jgi:predicted kinase
MALSVWSAGVGFGGGDWFYRSLVSHQKEEGQMKLILLRGVSGSGKSTKASRIVADFLISKPARTTKICSADLFFMKDGQYTFDPKKLGMAHSWCKSEVKKAMDEGTDLIILDNTSTQKWEMEAYYKLAETFNYKAEEVIVGAFDEANLQIYALRNQHGVSLDIIRKQAKRFER